jgi:MFS family permease
LRLTKNIQSHLPLPLKWLSGVALIIYKNMMSDKTKRWTVLAAVSIVMMMGYVFWDIVSPLSTQLKAPVGDGGMGWTSAEYGFYAGSYSIFNIFLLMLFFGGIILDKCGIRFTGLLATGCMLGGALVNYLALILLSPEKTVAMPFTLFGLIPATVKLQVLVAALGFGVFGMGCDITGITVSKIVTKWFRGKELASAMGVQVALARLGTASALSLSPVVAQIGGLSAPVLVGAFCLFMAFVIFVVYCFEDKKYDAGRALSHVVRPASAPAAAAPVADGDDSRQGLGEQGLVDEVVDEDDSFHFRDILGVLRNRGFWLIAVLCVFFYSSIRPFMKFATDLLVNKFGTDPVVAGWCVAIIPYGTIVLTPLFGSLYDRTGRGQLMMTVGCVFVLVSHILLALPGLTAPWVPVVVMVLIGISFSLVPSALWPSVPKLVPLKQLGTAYSIIYFIQNLGLMLVPIWVGDVIGRHTLANGRVDFTQPMIIFAVFGALAVAASLLGMVRVRK